jgi:hypothetical protein
VSDSSTNPETEPLWKDYLDVDIMEVSASGPATIVEGMRPQQRFTSPNVATEPAGSGPVRIRITEAKGGEGLVEMWLDYEKADVPSRAYFADYVDVQTGRADVTLIFGRLVPGTKKLRTQVEISFSRDSFVAQLWKSSRAFHEGLKKNPEFRLPPMEGAVYSDTVHTSRANNVFMAMMGEEAILDFYYIAPSEIHFVKAGQRNRVNLDPVIRISLPSPLVLEFLDKCDDLVSQMPEAQRIIKREEEAEK